MGKLMRGVALLGVAAGAVVVARKYLSGENVSGEDDVQITLSDGSLKTISTRDIEGQEFADIARKLVESGV